MTLVLVKNAPINMMQPTAKNPYIDALLKLMLFSASLHMAILIANSLFSGNFGLLNYFDILDLEWIFPSLSGTGLPFILGTLLALGIYTLFLVQSINHQKKFEP